MQFCSDTISTYHLLHIAAAQITIKLLAAIHTRRPKLDLLASHSMHNFFHSMLKSCKTCQSRS